jgi:hypothetical protein
MAGETAALQLQTAACPGEQEQLLLIITAGQFHHHVQEACQRSVCLSARRARREDFGRLPRELDLHAVLARFSCVRVELEHSEARPA